MLGKMQDLRACPSCRRHVDTTAGACPFCAVELPAAPDRPRIVGRLSRAAAFTSLTLAGTACWREAVPDGAPQHVALQGGAFAGIVSSGEGPLTGVTVHAVPVSTPAGPGFTAVTDDTGHYRLEHLPAGKYNVTYYYADTEAKRRVAIEEGGVEQVDLQLAAPRAEHHNVPMPYGAPPARRRVV